MKDDGRPDPEDLLARYHLAMKPQIRERGKLRVYLGAAPGVGKTYTMLAEGHRLKAAGRDVVVGLVETHGRDETQAMIGDLEVIPQRRVTYRGVTISELDVAAVLDRAPQIALVDELAHTNAPGSPREKRWEDVEVLRDSGIDVITTMNVQHIESLNHIVESITGVAVREIVPDSVVAQATDVQLVDLPVEALIDRLEAGKIYPPQRAQQALQNFFREGNLNALRELALRQTAADVDERLVHYMHEHEIAEVWPAAERVAVLIDVQPAGALLRAGWRLASVLRTEMFAVAVVPLGGLDQLATAAREAIVQNLRLAEDLGAIPRTVEAKSPAEPLAAFLQAENVNLLVAGHAAARAGRPFGRSLVDQLFELVDNVQIHLVELR